MTIITSDPRTEAKQRFMALHAVLETSLNGLKNGKLSSFRQKGLDKFSQLGFPTTRNEDWKYSNINRLVQPKYDIASLDTVSDEEVSGLFDEDDYRIVFIDGFLSKKHSSLGQHEGITITTIEEALTDPRYVSYIEDTLNKTIDETDNPFVALNLGFVREGIFVHVHPNEKVLKKLRIIHFNKQGNSSIFSSPVQLFFGDKNSDITVYENFISKQQGASLTLGLNVIQLMNQAKMVYYKVQELGVEENLVHNMITEQQRDSVFSAFTADLGGRMVRNNLSAIHKASNVETNLYGLFLASGNQHIDNQTFVDHAQPHCVSNEWYKGILTDRARGVFNGKVMVRPDAQKINAFQQNNALILSENARMDSKPQLEIFADDVRCSHGATIGQLDENAIFYLRSRGLSIENAYKILQLAFVQEVTDRLDDLEFRALIEEKVGQKFSK